eukprot:Tbor_TRINITY_DN5463_c1_g6::TRINITY_DN5463_c1_g6_i1::g.25061::m.25061
MTILSTYEIIIDPPDTEENFKAYNKECEILDSEFLMQPINEADYDSETQACVDQRTGGPKSFYDHFVTKRRKKKGKKGVGIEHPASIGNSNNDDSHLIQISIPTDTCDGQEVNQPKHSNRKELTPSNHNLSIVDHLDVPNSGHLAVPKGVLNNVVIRRLACGRMPPEMRTSSPPQSPPGRQ